VGDERIGSVEEFAEATQIAQGTIFQFGIEYMRRRKPKSTAISICHFITFAPDMKWGVVDYFQVPKISYEFVRRAYQPLLVSLDYSKRRWLPGETFQAVMWLVNDFHRDFNQCTLQIDVTDHHGNRLATRNYEVERVAADSSTQSHSFDWQVQGNRGETFRVDVRLRSKGGVILSANQYVLLLDDQEAARKRCRERAIELQAIRKRFGKADYYRFFPAYSGQERTERIGDTPPSASTSQE
jgi:beta-mannosidase